MTDRELIQIIPSPRQKKLQDMEFYAFVHFTVNTFTDKEWGDGTEDPAIFNPVKMNARQWVDAIKSAGMKGLILTCKHHDGFCLWPSAYTDHSVASSPYKNGKGDIVREVAEACREGGIRFGVYLSPWDRNQPLYGTGKPYDDYFINQLTELLTNYGDVCSVWFDGACGEGPNGKKQYYDWDRYYATIRELQPDACIHVCGPDIRWCGNEAGHTRKAEWSVVPRRTADTEKVASASQQADETAFRQRPIRAQDMDLGSREILSNETDLIWYPAEVNTSIRPGWFWHECENEKVRPLDELTDIYEKSVGGNATMLLNIPPTPDGLFHENDVCRLKEIGHYLRKFYSRNITADQCTVTSSAHVEGHAAANILTDDESWFEPVSEGNNTMITFAWPEAKQIDRIVMKEQIEFSQRVGNYTVDAYLNNKWESVAGGTVIGHKRIISLPAVKASGLRITFDDVRVKPVIRFIGIYTASEQ